MSGQTFERRARHNIIVEVLKITVKGAKKTHIMHKANLSFYQVQRYLNALKKADFLAEDSGIWKTTEKGLHVIEACDICEQLFKDIP